MGMAAFIETVPICSRLLGSRGAVGDDEGLTRLEFVGVLKQIVYSSRASLASHVGCASQDSGIQESIFGIRIFPYSFHTFWRTDRYIP